MIHNKLQKVALAAAIAVAALSAKAETVLLNENFDNDYSSTFSVYDGDNLMPAYSIQSLFMSPDGVYMPWWPLRESAAATDRFIGSHSYYSPAAKSNDWLISKAITIPSANFTLTFDAQSVNLRGAAYTSDLHVFVTEQRPGKLWLPDETAAQVFRQVPAGATADVTTDEWTRYSINMDKWIGKTVYISFANLNNNKDILCIDNVKVSRDDVAELIIADVPEYITTPHHTFNITVKAVADDVKNWQLTVATATDKETFSGTIINQGNEQTVNATLPFPVVTPTTYTITLTADGTLPVVRNGVITRTAFHPLRRVLLEETTGLWCSNCPRGIYQIESLMDDENINQQVVPVSVHISGASPDLMAMDEYADFLGIPNQAPVVRINRDAAVGFASLDNAYNPSTENSFANRVYNEATRLALFDIDVTGEWVLNGTDTVAVDVTARVRPAINFSDPSRFRVGFILTENNVGMDASPFWVQENGVAGYPIASKLGGWTELPKSVLNMRYHYVARAIPQFGGIVNSFTQLEAGKEYTVSTIVDIPDTRTENAAFGITSQAVHTKFCDITAYIVDTTDKTIANCARAALCDEPYKLFTAADLVAINAGVDDIIADPATNNADPAVYDLTGRRVLPSHESINSLPAGIYISSGKKIVVK